VATADPGTLPDKATWYLATNLPRPGGPREPGSPHPAAGLAEVVRIYGIRHWTEQGYKQVKDEPSWADFQVRSDIAIRRHRPPPPAAGGPRVCSSGGHSGPARPARTPGAAPHPRRGGGGGGAAAPGPAVASLAGGGARGAPVVSPADGAAGVVDRLEKAATA